MSRIESKITSFDSLTHSFRGAIIYILLLNTDPNTRIPFTVVGADAGYLDHPVSSTNLVIAMAERYEIVIDFDKYKGQNMTLMNDRDFQTNPDYPATDRVLRFVVGNSTSSSVENGNIPDHYPISHFRASTL
jgi:bilirubin oxidase